MAYTVLTPGLKMHIQMHHAPENGMKQLFTNGLISVGLQAMHLKGTEPDVP